MSDSELRRAPGMRERSPDVWELIVEAGRDPVTGKRRQVSRIFRGNLRAATKARAALLTEVSRGRHVGTSATVDDLFVEWVKELERKGRSPHTIVNYRKAYRVSVREALGSVPVSKVTTKMLTDLYGHHQAVGRRPATVRQIHATVSSMMTQACRWGWRDSNPAQWAEPPPLVNEVPRVPTPGEVRRLVDAARESRRPEYARLIYLAATSGLRRGELCALRVVRDVDLDAGLLLVQRSIVEVPGRDLLEAPTKNRRVRYVALDERTVAEVAEQIAMVERRAEFVEGEVVADPFLFSDALDGSEPWKPGAVTRYFARLRRRVGLDDLTFQSLRRFMGTYGQELGFSAVQVAMRAGHDPSVAARHYTGRVAAADRELADAVSTLLGGGVEV